MPGFEGYNRRRLSEFLYYFPDLWELGAAEHDAGGVSGRSGGRGPDPLRGYIGNRVDDPVARASHEALLEAVEELRRRKWHLYGRISPLYFPDPFGPEPNPDLRDAWVREAANGSVGDRIALGHHEEALDFMLRHAEKRLAERGIERLVVDVPLRARTDRAERAEKRRKKATEILVEQMDRHRGTTGSAAGDRAAAIRAAAVLVAEETGKPYSLKEMRVLAREIEGSDG